MVKEDERYMNDVYEVPLDRAVEILMHANPLNEKRAIDFVDKVWETCKTENEMKFMVAQLSSKLMGVLKTMEIMMRAKQNSANPYNGCDVKINFKQDERPPDYIG